MKQKAVIIWLPFSFLYVSFVLNISISELIKA